MLPNTLIGGAQKSGTTTLHRMLERHPDAFTPARHQEIHFFDRTTITPRDLEEYRCLFREWAGERCVFQTSPLYLYEPLAAGRIATLLEAPRLVFILRNPVDRAYSQYWHEIRMGWEDRSFEEALVLEEVRVSSGPVNRRHFSYFDRGRYSLQLARYLALNPREHLLAILTDDLGDTGRLASTLAGFLGLDPDSQWTEDLRASQPHFNRAMVPRSAKLQRVSRHIRQVLPRVVYFLDRINLRKEPYPSMKKGTRERLVEAFRREVDALEEILGRDLTTWRA